MTITIPQGSIKIRPLETKSSELVVFVAGGRAPSLDWLQAIAQSYPVWAVDRGIDICQAAGVVPQILLGDADSATPESWRWMEDLSTSILHYPSDKDDSDLQLALCELASQRSGAAVILTGGWGGRFDHAWSNVASLIQAIRRGNSPVALVDQAEAMFLLSGGQQLTIDFSQLPKIISLISLTPVCEEVVSEGVHWPLSGSKLSMYEPTAISNRLAENSRRINVSLQAGILGVYCCWQENGL